MVQYSKAFKAEKKIDYKDFNITINKLTGNICSFHVYRVHNTAAIMSVEGN